MTKKLLMSALALLLAAPMVLADNGCTVGGTPVAQIMMGSAEQFSSTAYAAQEIITSPGCTFNLFSVKSQDTAGSDLAKASRRTAASAIAIEQCPNVLPGLSPALPCAVRTVTYVIYSVSRRASTVNTPERLYPGEFNL